MGTPKGIVNPNVLNAFTALHFEYARGLDEAPYQWSDALLEEVPASPTLVDQFFIDLTTGGFRPWTGERQMRDTLQDSFSISKEPFEDSMKIPKILAMNGTYQAIARSEGQRFAASHMTFKNKMARKMLQAGATTTCWDGVPFFSLSHPIDKRKGAAGGVYPNLITAVDFTAPNWAAQQAILESVVAPNGETYGAQVTDIIYPPGLNAKVKAVFGKEHLAGGESNEYFDDIDKQHRHKSSDLANENDVLYLVLSVLGKAKALPYVETELNTQSLGEESEFCAMTGNVAELADFHASAGYANPRLLVRWKTT